MSKERFEECKEIISTGYNKGDGTMCIQFLTYDEVEVIIDLPMIEFLFWFDKKTMKNIKEKLKEHIDKL